MEERMDKLIGANKACYFGIFDVFSPGRGSVPSLVMGGRFTHDDLYMVNIKLDEYMCGSVIS